ncbi:helix-turn-helix domain-containing protein [Streptomyces niveus]|uniref:helix-turn-helix domain-containing protein n=1 Tax=Streptomyces niveus TaxID=193462 RepID=UPI0034444641
MDIPTPSEAAASPPLGPHNLPVRRISINRLVAYNIAHFRGARGLTQGDLGKRLERITQKRWSKATMSAVERSWDGSRIRSFDADDLLAFSQALEVPVTALFLPPEEDGRETDFVFTNVGSTVYRAEALQGGGTGGDLLAQLFASEYNYSYSSDPFFKRLQEALQFYFGSTPDHFFISRNPESTGGDAKLEGEASSLRRQIAALREVMATLERAASNLENADPSSAPQGS